MAAALGEPTFAALSSWSPRVGSAIGFGNLTVVDKVAPEMLHMIDPHWYQFEPMNPLWHSILGFVICMLGLISTIGNGCVVFIFTSTKNLRTPSNLLVVNLAFSDFLMMVSVLWLMGLWKVIDASRFSLRWLHQWSSTATDKHGALAVSQTLPPSVTFNS